MSNQRTRKWSNSILLFLYNSFKSFIQNLEHLFWRLGIWDFSNVSSSTTWWMRNRAFWYFFSHSSIHFFIHFVLIRQWALPSHLHLSPISLKNRVEPSFVYPTSTVSLLQFRNQRLNHSFHRSYVRSLSLNRPNWFCLTGALIPLRRIREAFFINMWETKKLVRPT